MTFEQIIMIVSTVISIAAVLASLLPQPSQDKANKYIGVARKVLDIIAFNFGHAKNQPRADK
ncbi:MAG: hypothetical protein EOM46_22945 [Gammaproteobacteria bacterium]|nr:hypothetical protein [Gammaproteobacteria bacterium]